MTPDEAVHHREAVVLHAFTDQKERYTGNAVYSVTEKGIVIAVSITRIFFPWTRVTSFSYHIADVSARKVIQGY